MPVSNFFIREYHQKEFENYGYVKLPLVEQPDLIKLQALFSKYFSDLKSEAFIYSNFLNNKAVNTKIQNEIKSILLPAINTYITNFRAIIGLFYIKPYGKESNFYIHRDWTIVDEKKYSSINVWLPLSETNSKNGNLIVVPGSHKKETLRGSPTLQVPKPTIAERIKNHFNKRNVYTQPGEAILFDHNLIHSSKSNRSKEYRIVAALSVIPLTAKVLHYHQNKNGKIEKYFVDDDFYLDFNSNLAQLKTKESD